MTTLGARERIVQAAYDRVAANGFSKTSVEAVARRAGLSRATVYRHFPNGREELLAAVVAWEHARFFARLYEEVRGAGSLEEVLALGIAFARRDIAAHEVLQQVLASEPELLLPKLTVEAAGAQQMIAAFLRPYLEAEELAPGVVVPEAADFLARMALSFIASPGRWDLENPAQVQRLVRAELLGGILPPSRAARSRRAKAPAAPQAPRGLR